MKSEDKSQEDQVSLAGAWYMVGVLMIAYTFSFIDRSILSLLVSPIRSDLNISDTQFSLLHGIAFALFYTGLGIPIARLADRYSRKHIISIGIFVWSIATAICGLARNFAQLFLSRMMVGVGEAALSPAAYSMITDSFPKNQLGRALAVYNTGAFFGTGLAFVIGGVVVSAVSGVTITGVPLVGELKGWQLTFFIVGLPGLLIALLCITLKEPERSYVNDEQIPVAEVLKFMRGNGLTFATHFLGFSALTLFFNGFMAWTPALINRRFELPTGEAGIYLGYIVLVFATAGILAGGWIADWYSRQGYANAPIRTGLIAALALIPLGAAAPLMPNLTWTLVIFCPLMFFISFPWAAAAAAIQLVAPGRMRAQISALYLFVVNLTGIGFGPTAVALFTDYVFGDDNALPYSLAIVGPLSAIVASVLLYLGLKPFAASIARNQ